MPCVPHAQPGWGFLMIRGGEKTVIAPIARFSMKSSDRSVGSTSRSRSSGDDADLKPLRRLSIPGDSEVYLRLVRYRDGVPGAQRRADAAPRLISRLGWPRNAVWGVDRENAVARRILCRTRSLCMPRWPRQSVRPERRTPARAVARAGAASCQGVTHTLRCVPRPVIVLSITSPGVSQRLPWWPALPAGEPVRMMSPGSRSTIVEAQETSRSTP